ncbi:MAG: hypothetical protein HDR01_13440 [Lachnospiraceae bacterium]|nr:hypothetical protein [Lachnospiraceae bacterium]
MSINVTLKNDYSFLFSGMMTNNSTGGSSLSNLLADYASIKNGSYGKLMKAYYSRNNGSTTSSAASSSTSKSNSKDDDKTIAEIKTSSSSLYSSTKALLDTGEKSVFKQEDITTKDENGVESTVKGYNTDKIYKAVKSFVDDYNNMLEEGSNSYNSKILNSLKSMISTTKANERLLSKVGITINSDDTISINEEEFKKADMTTVKSIFNSTGSYGYSINTRAAFINSYAVNDAKAGSGLYSSSANYLSSYNTGKIYSSFV